MTFYKMSSSSKAQAGGAFVPLVVSFLLGHQRRQWLPGGVVSVRMRTVVWALIALDVKPILVLVFPQYFQVWFFIPHRVHSLSDFRLSTTF